MQGNLLVIIGRGFRSDAISDEGVWPLRTPNMERLASRGLRLVATSACPNDPGGMASLLTGLHPRQHGQLHSAAHPRFEAPAAGTFCHWLKDAGYHVAGVGRLDSLASTMDDAVSVEDVSIVEPSERCAYMAAVRGRGLSDQIIAQRRQRLRGGLIDPDRVLLDPEMDIDGFIGTEAVKLIDRLPTNRPWALVVIFSGPGNLLPPPTLYQTLVEEDELAAGFLPADFTVLNAVAEPTVPRSLLQRLNRPTIARVRADYLARVALIDHGIGRLTSAIALRSDAEKSWTLLAADRGELLGEHGLLGHRSFISGALQTPLIVTPPNRADKKYPTPSSKAPQLDAMVSTVDIAATVAALSGCDMPRDIAGRSVLPLLYDEPIVGGHCFGVISEFHDRVMIETERYKAVFNRQTRRCLGIYDLLMDAPEQHSLIDAPKGRNVLDSIRLRLGDVLMPLRAVSDHAPLDPAATDPATDVLLS